MIYWFSPLLIAVGQVLAILLFFLYGDHHALQQKPYRLPLTVIFFFVHTFAQTLLHNYVFGASVGSLPALQYISSTLLYYMIFVRLWSSLSLPVCAFIALIFLLNDNCAWPLISSLSRLLWGTNYLYQGPHLLRLLFIAALWSLECSLMCIIRRLLPALHKIRMDRYNIILTLSSVIPFLYIRVFSSRLTVQDNKTLQIAMTICCLVALITLVGGVGRTSTEYEKLHAAQMQYILQTQQQQFQQKLQDIDAVNRKYHDMKHVLLYLEAHQNTQEMQGTIQKLLQDIRPFERLVMTGNEAIDILLSEKLALCQEKQISCVPYLDGTMFDFIEPLDLCTIFGNALDNAIESCSQIPEAADRQISVKATRRDNVLVLTIRNTYASRPDFRDGLPLTTKRDSQNHGYGLGNIQYVVEKYHGEMSCRIENQEFLLTLLFVQEMREG